MQWQLRVWDSDGSNERTYGVGGAPGSDAPVAEIEQFDVAPDGNCLTASWRASARDWDVPARSIVQIRSRERATDPWEPRWKGVVVNAGSTRADGLSVYRAVGLKQRYYELLVDSGRLPENADAADAALFAITALAAIPPRGVTADTATFIPTTGFQIGVRYPAGEARGALADAISAAVGPFTVAEGEEYLYAGRTYQQGDRVPGVTWGVNADGFVFFSRRVEAERALRERSRRVLVEWGDTQAEEVVDVVRLVFIAGVDQGLLLNATAAYVSGFSVVFKDERIAVPLTAEYGPGLALPAAERSVQRIDAENPLDLMTESVVGIVSAPAWNAPELALDGSSVTYTNPTGSPPDRRFASQVPVGGADALTAEVRAPTLGFGPPYLTDRGVWRITYSSDDPVPMAVFYSEDTSGNYVRYVYEIPSTNTDEAISVRDVFLPSLPSVLSLSATPEQQRLVIVGVDGLRVYRLRFYRIDHGAAERYASAFLRPVQEDVATVDVQGLQPILTALHIEPADGSATVTMPVERIEYRITPDDGARTRYYAGSAYDPSIETERVVLERMVERISGARSRDDTPSLGARL